MQAEWGCFRTYQVSSVAFDKNPLTHKVPQGEFEISMAKYFADKYGEEGTLQDTSQPLLVVQRGKTGDVIYLPPEKCVIAGLPQGMSKIEFMKVSREMKKRPEEKLRSHKDLLSILEKDELIGRYGLKITDRPEYLPSSVLPPPQIECDRKNVDATPDSLGRLPVYEKGAGLREWVFVYAARDFDCADSFFQNLLSSAKDLGVALEEPTWVELAKMHPQEVEKTLPEAITKHTQIVLFFIGFDEHYRLMKHKLLTKFKVNSQGVRVRTIQSSMRNASKMANIAKKVLKQMVAKVGSDLYRLYLPKEVRDYTMLVGIDVCHQGSQSIIGFCSSYSRAMTQYFSHVAFQKRGQEIIPEKLEECFTLALKAFEGENRRLPEHIVIYRDGVGDGMRSEVVGKEVAQLTKLLAKVSNQVAGLCSEVTLIIVNKRVMQRFFLNGSVAGGRGLLNPHPGTLVNSSITERADAQARTFDFFLVPQSTTVGCVVPTHFCVDFNTSPMSKEAIQQLTYSLCWYYYNWEGSIKVPAPCMYAHNIAKKALDIGVHGKGDITRFLYYL